MNNDFPLYGFDIDDVCFHSFGVIADTIKDWYGSCICEPTNFKIEEQCPDIHPDDIYKAIDHALVDRFDKMEPVHGSILFLKRYQEFTKNKITFITSRNPTRVAGMEEATIALLQKWLPDLEYEVLFPKRDEKTKGTVCKERGINVFVEDRVKYCVDVSDHGCLALMMTRTWNKKFSDPDCIHRIVRVGNWYDVNMIFDSLLRINCLQG